MRSERRAFALPPPPRNQAVDCKDDERADYGSDEPGAFAALAGLTVGFALLAVLYFILINIFLALFKLINIL